MHTHPLERFWIYVSAGLLVVFAAAVAFSSLVLGIELPGIEDPAMPAAAAGEYPPNQGWIRELAPGRYEVNLLTRVWAFEPGEIRVPQGSTVTFYLHSEDLLHGFRIQGTTVSLMAIPGQVGKVTYTFNAPGEYPFVCHEYCGVGHHLMSGRVIVEGN